MTLDLQALALRYEAGETFEEIALDVNMATPTLRHHLRPYVTARRQGAQVGKAKNNFTSASESKSTTNDAPTGTGSIVGHRAVGRAMRKGTI